MQQKTPAAQWGAVVDVAQSTARVAEEYGYFTSQQSHDIPPDLCAWNQQSLARLAYLLEWQEVTAGEFIQRQGADANDVYFVYSGEFWESRRVDLHTSNSWPKRRSLRDPAATMASSR